jgi:uncharacterized repeat protein (TIGR03803 family)
MRVRECYRDFATSDRYFLVPDSLARNPFFPSAHQTAAQVEVEAMTHRSGRPVCLSAFLLSAAFWLIILSLSAQGQTFTVIHNFAGGPNDGAYPEGPLVRDSGGHLYGASLGGTLSWGTVFEIFPSGQERVLYNFLGGADGVNPSLSFAESGMIVGTTYQGGVNEFGTVFKLNSQGKLTNLFSCCSPTEIGAFTGGVIQDVDGNLFVVSFAGGDFSCSLTGCGTIFKLSGPNAATLVHTFGGEGARDGQDPNGSLVRDDAGSLYGTTLDGGASGYGTIFKIVPGDSETVLYSFEGSGDGSFPSSGVYRDPQGNLYGTTASGGSHNLGTVFKVTNSGEHLVLHDFSGSDGDQPTGGVILDPSGNIYGVTYLGGRHNKGTVFKLNTNGDLTVLHDFSGASDGAYPENVLPMNGTLYGVTYQGGTYNLGVLFRLAPD